MPGPFGHTLGHTRWVCSPPISWIRQGSHMSDVVTGQPAAPADGGKPIVLTAPLTEIIDHAGYFIQMSMASLPIWLEGILNRKYPQWRDLEYSADGTAR